jgi:hypothetical protein
MARRAFSGVFFEGAGHHTPLLVGVSISAMVQKPRSFSVKPKTKKLLLREFWLSPTACGEIEQVGVHDSLEDSFLGRGRPD